MLKNVTPVRNKQADDIKTISLKSRPSLPHTHQHTFIALTPKIKRITCTCNDQASFDIKLLMQLRHRREIKIISLNILGAV